MWFSREKYIFFFLCTRPNAQYPTDRPAKLVNRTTIPTYYDTLHTRLATVTTLHTAYTILLLDRGR